MVGVVGIPDIPDNSNIVVMAGVDSSSFSTGSLQQMGVLGNVLEA